MHPLPPACYRQEHGCKDAGGGGRLCAHLWADALVPVLRPGGWVCPGVSSLVLMSVLHTEAMQSLQECEVQECALCVQRTCMS